MEEVIEVNYRKPIPKIREDYRDYQFGVSMALAKGVSIKEYFRLKEKMKRVVNGRSD